MKRSPLRRVASLVRKVRLARQGKRAEREKEALRAFREAVLERAFTRWGLDIHHGEQKLYRCERCGQEKPAVLIHAHHLLSRARGGSHDPSNGAALCSDDHRAIHSGATDAARWIHTRKGS